MPLNLFNNVFSPELLKNFVLIISSFYYFKCHKIEFTIFLARNFNLDMVSLPKLNIFLPISHMVDDDHYQAIPESSNYSAWNLELISNLPVVLAPRRSSRSLPVLHSFSVGGVRRMEPSWWAVVIEGYSLLEIFFLKFLYWTPI